MKYLKILLIVIAIGLFGCKTRNSGGVQIEGQTDKKFVFWFYVRGEERPDRITKKPSYQVRTTSKKPTSGTLAKFDKDLWRSLVAGNNLLIGPFDEYKDAMRAITMYDLMKKTDEIMEKEISEAAAKDDGTDYYWYFLKYSVTPRNHKILFERTPARVASGPIPTFKQVLWEGLKFKQLAIGPFPTAEQAEESKRRFRIEEN